MSLAPIDRAKVLLICVALFAGCGGKHGINETLKDQNFQTPMIDVRDARALFVGDSITASWSTAEKNRNTGVPGAGAELIGRRFAAEIQAGSPRYVHILAGTNDVGGGRDAPSIAIIGGMVTESRARGIPVIVGTVPPLDAVLFPTLYQHVAPFNAALVADVKPRGAYIADYHAAMALPSGLQNPALFKDGIHPNEAGYEVMNKVLRGTMREMRQDGVFRELRQQARETRKLNGVTRPPEQRAERRERREERQERREERRERREARAAARGVQEGSGRYHGSMNTHQDRGA